MKTDRELLELAARAAGYKQAFYTASFSPAILFGHHPKEGQKGVAIGDALWNPLTDDGDALRLAVKLRITPDFNPTASSGVFTGYELVTYGKRSYHNPIVEPFGADDFAATRRAIVRRAAEIAQASAPAGDA